MSRSAQVWRRGLGHLRRLKEVRDAYIAIIVHDEPFEIPHRLPRRLHRVALDSAIRRTLYLHCHRTEPHR